jgi:hypothetical protein
MGFATKAAIVCVRRTGTRALDSKNGCYGISERPIRARRCSALNTQHSHQAERIARAASDPAKPGRSDTSSVVPLELADLQQALKFLDDLPLGNSVHQRDFSTEQA